MVLAVRTSGGKQMAQECCTLSSYFHYSVALVFFLETKSAEAVQTPKLALRNWKAAWAVRLPGCTTRVLLCSEGGRYLWHRPPAAHQPAPQIHPGGPGPLQVLLLKHPPPSAASFPGQRAGQRLAGPWSAPTDLLPAYGEVPGAWAWKGHTRRRWVPSASGQICCDLSSRRVTDSISAWGWDGAWSP